MGGSSRCAGLLDRERKDEAALGGSSRCAGLLNREREEAALGGAPAAQGCSIERGRRLLWGVSRCAGLLNREREEAAKLLWGELPLGWAAR